MKVNDYIKTTENNQCNEFTAGVNAGIEFMENNVEFVEDIINAYYTTKIQLEEEKVAYLNHHDFCARVLTTFKLSGKTYK